MFDFPSQSSSADVYRELHTVHQKLCNFPHFWRHKVINLHVKLNSALQMFKNLDT